jgi:WD40 repeat protein/serine/threonine protein kinase
MARPGDIPTINSGVPPERQFSSGPPDDARARASFPTLDIAGALAHTEPVMPNLALSPLAPLGAAALGVTKEHEGRYAAAEEGELGRGGIGRVFVAVDRHLDRSVAIKELLLEHGDDPTRPGTVATLARFLREARITGKLDHPNIVPVYELGRRADGSLYYTMRVVRGRTLSQALGEARTLAERLKLLDHFVGLCQAIAYAHSRGVMHRDIKPDNVMIGEFGETVVLDWGMAKAQGSDAFEPGSDTPPALDRLSQSLDLTVDGSLCGTPTHMSPEQVRGAVNEVDERSDVWALGVVLYTILSGRTPFEGKTLIELVQHIRAGKCPPLRSLDSGIPPELAAITERALKAAPNERYQNAKELLRDVEAYRSGAQVQAYRYSSLDLLKRFLERHRTVAVASSVGLSVAFVLAVASYVRLAAARDRAQAAEQRATQNELEARSSERRAKHSLSEVLVEKAQQASNDGDRAGAELLAAEALALTERADARGIVVAAESSFRPEPTFSIAGAAGCTRTALSGETQKLACARNGTITLFSLQDGKAEAPIALAGTTSALAFSADGSRLVAASTDGKLRVLSVTDAQRPTVFERRVSAISAAALSAEGRYAVAGGPHGGVLLWDLGEARASSRSHDKREWRLPTRQGISALAFAPDSASVAVGGELGSTLLWDFAHEKSHELAGHSGTVRAFAFAQGGRYLATGAADRTIRLWDTREYSAVSGPIAHSDAVSALTWSADGRLLAFGSKDKTLNLLDPKSPERRTQVRFHDDSVDSLGFSFAGNELVSVSRELGAMRWSLASLKTATTLVERGNVLAFAFVPGKNELVSGGLGAAGLGIFDLNSGLSQTRLPTSGERVRALAVSSDGSRLASAGSGAQVLLWDLPARIPLRAFDVRDEARAVAFSRDDRWLAFAGLDRTLRVVDTATFARVAELDAGTALQALAFSTQSGLLFSGDRDGALSAWDIPGKRRTLRIQAHDDWLLGVAVSSDGRRLATSGADRHVKIWDAISGKPLLDLTGHEGKVLCVEFSDDGRFLASGSEDKSVRVWDLASGSEVARIASHGGAVRAVHFAPGRALLGSASDDGTIRLWKLETLTESGSSLRTKVQTRYRLDLAGTRVVRAGTH